MSQHWSARRQRILDQLVPWCASRWTSLSFLILYYLRRVYWLGGYYVITYGLGIYLLNVALIFLTPLNDPEDEDDGSSSLPTSNDEFRPFVRRLPEFKCWHMAFSATLVALFLTHFEMFDIPVFWPILLLYFIVLLFLTMRQRIQHMLRYRYVPWTANKNYYVST